ncbi:MAG: 2-oxoglutarate ferredoxin oxidoreductase subunit beta [Kiritimatiellia bacterium]|jgi:2-oxoglutarate ferredoxin oxidoreductase subunit beta
MDVHDRYGSINAIQAATKKARYSPGRLYVDTDPCYLHDIIKTTNKPLKSLSKAELCPGNTTLQTINDSFR